MRILRMRPRRASQPGRLIPCVLLLVGTLAFAPAARTEEPPVYAIINAKVVPVSGPVLEKGTVVIRDGLIEAVGTAVTVPPDARIIDASGLTVYPGLIDSLSDTGFEEPRAAPAPSRPAGPGPAPFQQQQASSTTPDERQGLTPWENMADSVNPSARKVESARAAGITTALVAPRGGFFQGQSALVNLAGEGAGSMVLKTPVAMHIGLASRGGFGRGYPGSLMGIMAFVKQTLMDAQHYEKAWSIYRANPGARRPEYNRALQALQPVVQRQMPVVLAGDNPEQIQRALDLASAFNLDMILSGGSEAARIASVLKERKIPVLVSVKYPERDRDEDPELQEELESLRRRVEAPGNAAALAKAGVKFAFKSGDTANPRDFVRNVGKAVEAGLDPDIALRALTLTAAEILGVADRVGSIEQGKTANLILTSGDLFDSRTQVKYAFVDGRRFVIPEPETPRPSEAGRPSGPSVPTNATGDWSVTVDSPQGPVEVTLRLQQTGSELTGTTESILGVASITEGRITGNSIRFRVTVNGPDGSVLPVTFTGTIQGNDISGSADVGPMGRMEFRGSKRPRTL